MTNLLRATALLVAASAAVGTAPAAAAPAAIATTDQPTAVRAWHGTALFSTYDAGTATYRLAVSEQGGPPRVLPLPAQAEPFDADIGPDRSGAATVVYAHCGAPAGGGVPDCGLRRLTLATGADVRIASTDDDAASETRPTIAGARVAWVSTDLVAPAKPPVVKVRSLASALERPSRTLRLPGVAAVGELELDGRWLAARVDLVRARGRETSVQEVRLAPVDGAFRQVAHLSPGISGQRYLGLGFVDGALTWARTCAGDPSGCGETNSGVFRYAPRTGRYTLAGFARRLTGFAYLGGRRAHEVRAPEMPGGYCGNSLPAPRAQCQVVLADEVPAFRPIRAPR